MAYRALLKTNALAGTTGNVRSRLGIHRRSYTTTSSKHHYFPKAKYQFSKTEDERFTDLWVQLHKSISQQRYQYQHLKDIITPDHFHVQSI